MSRDNSLMTISVDDVVRALGKYEDLAFDDTFEKVLRFASELTGISEDRLMEMMDGEREIDKDFVLSEDTDFGCDLMAFISDWREDFVELGFFHEDFEKIQSNQICFGVIAMAVQEYLNDDEIALDDIDMGRYTVDERVMDLVHIVDKAYMDYMNGNYTESAVKKFVECFQTQRAVVEEVLSDAQSRVSDTVSAAGKVCEMGRD